MFDIFYFQRKLHRFLDQCSLRVITISNAANLVLVCGKFAGTTRAIVAVVRWEIEAVHNECIEIREMVLGHWHPFGMSHFHSGPHQSNAHCHAQ